MVNIIVAYARNFVIGKDGRIPWHLPEDMQHFRETTMDCPVILGRKTWDSLPERFKPLPGRINLVVSRERKSDLFFDPKQPYWFNSLQSAVKTARNEADQCFIIGGGDIYRQALDNHLVDRVIASELHEDYDGDTFFPDLKKQDWIGTLVKEFERFKVIEYATKTQQ